MESTGILSVLFQSLMSNFLKLICVLAFAFVVALFPKEELV